MTSVVTGGTGFIGRRLVELLARRGGPVYVLVRPQSEAKVRELGLKNVHPLVGDITQPGLGVRAQPRRRLRGAEVFHLAAVYDLTAGEEANQQGNVEGTAHVVEFAREIAAARFHHVSSIAVAGSRWKGDFTEDMFDEGQRLDLPYYKTKFEAERLVRESGLPFRVYRPGIVIGSSEDGAADRVDGPYFAFKLVQNLRAALPTWFPLLGFEGGPFNVVPVDYVARAIDHLAGLPGRDGECFHVVDPDPMSLGDVVNEFCRAAHAPAFTIRLDRRALSVVPAPMAKMLTGWRVTRMLRRELMDGLGVPEAALSYLRNRANFTSTRTQAALTGSGIQCPPLRSYSWKIWDYWERHLDPTAMNSANLHRALTGRVALITGASSGIGRAAALAMAGYGAEVALVSRTREKLQELADEIAAAGGRAHVYPADLADLDACERVVGKVIADLGRVDILVNNAGRSIRRSFVASLDRFHDFERTMQLNYFGALKMMMAVIPGMRERGEGHIINVSSIGTQTYPPRFGAYIASKSALSGLSRCIGPELAGDGVDITTVHMPLVRTPMIAPTGIYRNFPTIGPDEAAAMILHAVLSRPPEVSTRLGKIGETVATLSPDLLHLVMTGAFHAFPESSGAGGKPASEELNPEAALLAYLMRGVHF